MVAEAGSLLVWLPALVMLMRMLLELMSMRLVLMVAHLLSPLLTWMAHCHRRLWW